MHSTFGNCQVCVSLIILACSDFKKILFTIKNDLNGLYLNNHIITDFITNIAKAIAIIIFNIKKVSFMYFGMIQKNDRFFFRT